MSSLRDRMYEYEVTPPASSWQKITTALEDAELHNDYPQRLFNMEVTPPASAWERVSSTVLPEAVTAIPTRRIPAFIRYAAAAILVGIIAFGVYHFAFRNQADESYSAADLPRFDTNKSVTPPPSENDLAESAVVPEPKQPAPIQSRSNMPGRSHTNTARATGSNAIRTALYQAPDHELSQSIYAYTDLVPDISDRYIMLMTPDGKLIRMSKKWSGLLCCVSGEEQDADCRDQIKKWQEKLATTTLSSAPGNFMDILNLVNTMDEGSDL